MSKIRIRVDGKRPRDEFVRTGRMSACGSLLCASTTGKMYLRVMPAGSLALTMLAFFDLITRRRVAGESFKISKNAMLAYEDPWRIEGVVEEAMRDQSDEPAATVAFHLRLKPRRYGVLRGARGLFGWDRQRREALLAVAEFRRDVLSMRHAVKDAKRVWPPKTE